MEPACRPPSAGGGAALARRTTDPCEVRFITVPPEIHNRYQHGANLPLYQMIAKNVGIRRARGRFILATNIDILFSDELAAFLGAQQLRTDRMYRIDRHDAMSEVPAGAPIEEQLAYCRSHLIRVNRREGTFEVTPDGGPVLSAVDIASAGSGILFGPGWFTPERFETARMLPLGAGGGRDPARSFARRRHAPDGGPGAWTCYGQPSSGSGSADR